MSKPPNHEFFMLRALELAMKGAGKAFPNPMVGAVFVKNGKIIAEGFHQKYAGKHAEVNVLSKMTKRQIDGGILYVTLEPCCHIGKTPPCTNFLISKGVKDIVLAMRDPNPIVSGKGVSQLKEAGVHVKIGVLEDRAKRLNYVFIKNMKTRTPWVSIKFGLTLDGKIGTLDGESKYITSVESRRKVHLMRSQVQAVLTTSSTVLKDDPHLGIRFGKGRDPLRVILDSGLRTDPKAKVFRDKNALVVATGKSSLSKRNVFQRNGIELLIYNKPTIPLRSLLRELYKKGIYHLLVEAGSSLATSLLREKLADELILFFAPKILGQGISWVNDLGIPKLKKVIQLKQVEVERFGNDIMIRGVLDY